ncbi:MAG: tRNA (adenosine(37)-N6)-threonylcarbamoyltransferase complex dimerization subunit type 1 TsaB [Gallionellaceae bacterium]|jgi:tRNA threonylcarbamoyladenosine biosynthesis protein TsaB
MKILALETSTEYCSVALWQDGIIAERSALVGQKHSEMLIGMLDSLLQDAGLKIQDMHGIAFGKGPGSFTGVRIACGVAQGLALGANLQVVGICTLAALAQAAGHPKVITALDARMGELYLAAYEKQDDRWQEVIAPCLCKAGAAPVLGGVNWHGAGSGFLVSGDELSARYAGQISVINAQSVPQAGAIAQLAALEFAAGNSVDAALALPLYLRDKVALKTSER